MFDLEIVLVENGKKPNEECVWVQAKKDTSTKNHALVDRTFTLNGKVSNEFRHIFVFPELNLKKGEIVIISSGKGTNGIQTFSDTKEKYYRLYWGADSCVWNNNGGDTVTLINFMVMDYKPVPAAK